MRGQAQTILIYVAGIIVAGLVILFGYNTLQNLNEDRCEAQRTQFGSSLAQAIDRNRAWGSNNVESFQPPCDTTQICFLNREKINESGSANSLSGAVKEVFDAIIETNQGGNSGDQTNVLTVSTEGNIEPIERFSTRAAAIGPQKSPSGSPIDAYCINVTGSNLRMRFQGDGRVVAIYEP